MAVRDDCAVTLYDNLVIKMIKTFYHIAYGIYQSHLMNKQQNDFLNLPDQQYQG